MSPSHGPLRQRVRRIPKGRHVAVRREEFDRLIGLLNQRGEVLNRVVQDQPIYSMSSDPRTGTIEHRLTNVRRAEPPANLFTIPDTYTIGSTGHNGSTALVFAERNGQATKRW